MTKDVNSRIFFIVVLFIDRALESGTISEALEIGLDNSEGLFIKMFKQNLATFTARNQLRQGIGNPNKQGPPPIGPGGQYKGVPPGLEDFLKMQKVQGGDSYYEPYWKDGQWVFERQVFTPRPPRFLAQYVGLDPNITLQCAETCPRIYEGYGTVCALSLDHNTGFYDVRQFINLCHMMFENCVKAVKRNYKWEWYNNAPWRPTNLGTCNMRWKKLSLDGDAVARDTSQYLQKIMPTESLNVSSPVPPHAPPAPQ